MRGVRYGQHRLGRASKPRPKRAMPPGACANNNTTPRPKPKTRSRDFNSPELQSRANSFIHR